MGDTPEYKQNDLSPKSGLSIIELVGLLLLVIINIPLLWFAISANSSVHALIWVLVLVVVDFIPFCIIVLAALSKNKSSTPPTTSQTTTKVILNIICALISIKIALVLVSMLFDVLRNLL